ncbi:MAG: TonB-dependent receptor, partial [Pseudomonadota bacterium]
GRYTGETRLNGSGLPGSSDLFFGDLVTFDLRTFVNVDQLTGGQSPVLKNLRVSLRMDNIFDGQRRVRDENGDTPINYQPFVIDPIGRFVGIDIRKLF